MVEKAGDFDLSVSVQVPTNDEEVLRYEGVIPDIALAAGAMARADGFFTIHEYEAFASTAESLFKKFPEPLLLRVLMLQGVLDQSISFKEMLRKINKAKKTCPQEDLDYLLLSISPICEIQGPQARTLLSEWASALGASSLTVKQIDKQLPRDNHQNKGWFSRKQYKTISQIDRAKHLSLLYKDQILLHKVEELPPDSACENSFLKMLLDDAFARAIDFSESRLKSVEEFGNEELAALNFYKMAETLVNQVKSRLSAVRRRLIFEMEMFQKDLSLFVENSVIEIELSMRHLVDGRDNWDDPLIWQRFAEGEAYKRVVSQWSIIDYRYSEQLKLWELELKDFSQEISSQIENALESIDPRAFAGLVPQKNMMISLKGMLDSTANVTLGAATVTLAGTGLLAVYSGFGTAVITKSFVGIASVVGGTAALPYLAAGGVIAIGGSAIYKLFSNHEKRKEGLIQSKRKIIKQRILGIIGDPMPKYRASLERVMSSFNDAATLSYSPLVKTSRLAVIQKKLELKAMERILLDTRRAFQSSE